MASRTAPVSEAARPQMQIFRFRDALDIMESPIMTDATAAGAFVPDDSVLAGLSDGASSRVVFAAFGMSVVHVWFKRFFPLPLHSHDCDCVYYIIAGGIRLGTEDLRPGDGFFVPADVPYTYRPGADGVELIEFRNRAGFDIRTRGSKAYWQKAAELVNTHRDEWITSQRLSHVEE